MLLTGVLAGHTSRDLHGCDSFYIASYPEDHPARAVYEAALSVWDSLFASDRAGNPKGYVEVSRE